MAFSDVRSFTEPGEFAAAIRGARVELCVFDPGAFAASVTYIELESLNIQRFSESHPRILHSTDTSGRAVIVLHTEPGPGLLRNGRQLTPNSIARPARYQSYFQRTVGPTNWGNISLPMEKMREAGIAAFGRELAPPPSELIVIPKQGALEKLRQLHNAAGILAQDAPEMIANPAVARGLEQALTEALINCLSADEAGEDKSARRRHSTIMRRFHAILRTDANRPLYVLEIAEQIGASVRSLSACCHEHLGMGPKKYLLLRRMHLARQALYAADPEQTTVTDVATQYGFWQFGRFAVEYKFLFGESPSVTLRRKRA